MEQQLSPEWKDFMDSELEKEYMVNLREVISEKRQKTNVFPAGHLTFNAFIQCPYNDLKVVILGQDPYHTAGHAHGLAFSTIATKAPPSLNLILDEVFNDFFNGNTGGINVAQTLDLSQWSWQGVLLLNTILTVEEGKPKSHADLGWETFTENAIKFINQHKHKLVFMLWGKDAKAYKKLINEDKHLVLESEHPAAAIHNKALWHGNKHFSKANNWIKKHYLNYKPPVNWGLFTNPNHIR